MPSAKITSKGQITVPKAVRERLNVGPGDSVVFREQADGSIVLEAESRDVMALAGSIKPGVKGVTLAHMADAVEQAAIARNKRSRRR
jgi:AbrB family looped-hinge helix DNA binding protein